MRRPKTISMLVLTGSTCLASLTGSTLAQESIQIDIPAPSWDRWNYAFNATPGFRQAGSTFAYWTESLEDPTDNRLGQIVFGFDTSVQFAPGQTAGMKVTSATITLQQSNEGVLYDSTTDPVETMLDPGNPERIEDTDAGQPIELFGVNYRNGWTSTTYPENGPYGDPDAETTRNVFAVAYRDDVLTDVTNQIKEAWTPEPFAVSTVEDVSEGNVIPIDSVHTFDIDVDDVNIQDYLLDGLATGELEFALAAMIPLSGQEGIFPNFYLKENALVEFGVASAATLQLTLEEDISSNPCDFNGDGIVGGADLARLLSTWGTSDPETDLDGNGQVGGSDLAILLGCWGD